MKIRTLLAVLLLTLACATPRSYDTFRRDYVTLLVVNIGLDAVRVYDAVGRIATVNPARSTCVPLRHGIGNNQHLRVTYVASSVVYDSPDFVPEWVPGWIIELDSMSPTTSIISLRPAAKCDPRR